MLGKGFGVDIGLGGIAAGVEKGIEDVFHLGKSCKFNNRVLFFSFYFFFFVISATSRVR